MNKPKLLKYEAIITGPVEWHKYKNIWNDEKKKYETEIGEIDANHKVTSNPSKAFFYAVDDADAVKQYAVFAEKVEKGEGYVTMDYDIFRIVRIDRCDLRIRDWRVISVCDKGE